MTQSTKIGKYFLATLMSIEKVDRAHMRRMLDGIHKIENIYLDYFTYRFLSGPFKGEKFMCDAPDTKIMGRHPNWNVIMLGKHHGLQTCSLITYDREIEKVETEWRKLL